MGGCGFWGESAPTVFFFFSGAPEGRRKTILTQGRWPAATLTSPLGGNYAPTHCVRVHGVWMCGRGWGEKGGRECFFFVSVFFSEHSLQTHTKNSVFKKIMLPLSLRVGRDGHGGGDHADDGQAERPDAGRDGPRAAILGDVALVHVLALDVDVRFPEIFRGAADLAAQL